MSSHVQQGECDVSEINVYSARVCCVKNTSKKENGALRRLVV
jgi:hypothetical protein